MNLSNLNAEILMARILRDLGHHSGTGLYDEQLNALLRLVEKGYVDKDLASRRRYTLNEAGLEWLAEQEAGSE